MDEYMGIIKLFGGNFAPKNWAFCNGQLIAISSNTALFSILGTTYGGDGRTTFALPDLRCRVAVGAGAGPGLNDIQLGEMAGEQSVTLLLNQMPAHNHNLTVNSGNASQSSASIGASIATPGSLSGRTFAPTLGFNTSTPDTALNPQTVHPNGMSMPHDNMMPYTGMNYIICTYGLFPSRN